ncbi:Aste57867_15367 [Aphanomyces stellatus]|uniref:Aste57867_15367 protein n=1 Tax=Aphanomyces stellatus TaxID=120398 RepID=A0A485L3Y0_9STRA|nr:hypothetical protein As57867_015311 [Aphanomyces stellatus]VFT92174.1 Aste57867_15367 [Aphanomyces stellatus]
MPPTGKRSIEELGEIVEASVNKAFKDRDVKQSVYSLPDMNSEKKRRILQTMGLAVNIFELEELCNTTIPVQRVQYMAYLEAHLMTQLNANKVVFSLLDIANDKTVLDTVDPRLPFRLNGTADVLLVKSKGKNLITIAGLSIVIELKKKVEKKHINQAIGQLICASIKAPLGCYPMSLLTDLNGVWHFCYFSDKSVLTQVTFEYSKNAIDFIKPVIVDQPERAIFPLPYFPVPFKKMRVDDFLLRPVDGHAAELMENYELMADELEPEFLMARRMEYAQHLATSTTGYHRLWICFDSEPLSGQPTMTFFDS